MKRLTRWLWLSLLVPLSACSSARAPIALPPVGPAPHEAHKDANEGYLVVYSAWSIISDSVNHHSRYTIASDDGKLSKEVQNYMDRFDPGPIRVDLPPGSYRVTARSARSGRVAVPVIIKEQQASTLYLDGSAPPALVREGQTNLVKLPDGEIVGWRAAPESLPQP